MVSYEVLVRRLLSGTLSEQHQAVAALLLLPLTSRNWMSAVGAIPRLVQLLHSTSTTAPQIQAIHHLLNLIESSTADVIYGGGGDVAPDGIIPPLISLLLRHDDAAVLSSAAANPA